MTIRTLMVLICVSSVDPTTFPAAVEAGAAMVEIGNNDSYYETSRIFTPDEILNLTKETRRILPSIVLSVTVPRALSLPDQTKLAELLEEEGADVIQSEGGKCSSPSKPGALGLIEKGVGSAVNKLNDVVAMIAVVRSIADSICERKTMTEETTLRL
ncbi:hypothetical protein AKJ16_DCAP08787 [Drosera capensis]